MNKPTKTSSDRSPKADPSSSTPHDSFSNSSARSAHAAPASRSTSEEYEPHSDDPGAIYFPIAEDRTRQEDKHDTDIKNIIRRHGGIPNTRRRQNIGAANYDLDLHAAIQMRDKVSTSFNTLPADVKKDFPNWQAVFNGIVKGKLHVANDRLAIKPPEPPPSPKVDNKKE